MKTFSLTILQLMLWFSTVLSQPHWHPPCVPYFTDITIPNPTPYSGGAYSFSMSRGGLGICTCYNPVLTITLTSPSWIQGVPSSLTFTSCYQTLYVGVTVLQNDGSSGEYGPG